MMTGHVRDREFLIFFKVAMYPSYLEIIAQFTKHDSIINVTSEWLCEQIDVQTLQRLWRISQPEAIDEIQHYFLLNFKLPFQYRAE